MKQKGKMINNFREFASINEINRFGLTFPKKYSKSIDEILENQRKIVFDFEMMHFQSVDGIYLCDAIPIIEPTD